MIDILLKNGEYVITMDQERRIIEDGSVAIDKGEILEVGKTDDLTEKYQAKTVIDAKDKVIMPGIIDGHAHPAQYLSKGIADDVAGLVGNASNLLSATNDLVRTSAGIGVFLAILGFLLMTAATWLVLKIS